MALSLSALHFDLRGFGAMLNLSQRDEFFSFYERRGDNEVLPFYDVVRLYFVSRP